MEVWGKIKLCRKAFEGVHYIIYHFTILHVFYKCPILANNSVQSPGQADTKSILFQCKERQSKNPLLISSCRAEKVSKFKSHWVSCDAIIYLGDIK